MTTVLGSTPYPWPWDGALDHERLALLVVAAPDEPRDPAPSDIRERGSVLAEAVEACGGVVVEVATTLPVSARRPPHDPPVARRTHAVAAHGVDGFFDSGLDPLLRSLGRDQLLLCGHWLETSVHSTMRSANDRGLECLLVLDACASFEPTLRAAARSQIEMSGGIFGAVGDSAAVIDSLRLGAERTTP